MKELLDLMWQGLGCFIWHRLAAVWWLASTWNNGSLYCHNIARSSAEQPSQPRAKSGICWVVLKNEISSVSQDFHRQALEGWSLQGADHTYLAELSSAVEVFISLEEQFPGQSEPLACCFLCLSINRKPWRRQEEKFNWNTQYYRAVFAALCCSITFTPWPGTTS